MARVVRTRKEFLRIPLEELENLQYFILDRNQEDLYIKLREEKDKIAVGKLSDGSITILKTDTQVIEVKDVNIFFCV